MRLQQFWLFGTLSGEVWDDPPGPPDRGVIEGHVSGRSVSFLKWMPVYLMWFDGRLLTFAEYILRIYDMPVDDPVPHPPIRYTGEYLAGSDELTGTWEFAPGTTQFVSEGRAWSFDIPAGSDTWMAHKVPEI
jgi:hypothetical protein